jgi:hypothetical protein
VQGSTTEGEEVARNGVEEAAKIMVARFLHLLEDA